MLQEYQKGSRQVAKARCGELTSFGNECIGHHRRSGSFGRCRANEISVGKKTSLVQTISRASMCSYQLPDIETPHTTMRVKLKITSIAVRSCFVLCIRDTKLGKDDFSVALGSPQRTSYEGKVLEPTTS